MDMDMGTVMVRNNAMKPFLHYEFKNPITVDLHSYLLEGSVYRRIFNKNETVFPGR